VGMELGDLPPELETQCIYREVQVVGLVFDHVCAGGGIGCGGRVSCEDGVVG
jgi:hypothetical protein